MPANARSTGVEDLFWWRPDGTPMTQADWDDPEARVLCAELRMASGTPVYAERNNALFLVFNAGRRDVTVACPLRPRADLDPPDRHDHRLVRQGTLGRHARRAGAVGGGLRAGAP
jgi:pullulanase/glycogen debranching enzyme